MSRRLEALEFPHRSAELHEGWDRLLAEASEKSPFLSLEWVRAWWSAYGDGREPLLLVGRGPEGLLTGLAPLYAWRPRWAGLPGPRVVSLMGDECVGSEYLGFLTRPGEEDGFLAALVDEIAGRWTLLDLQGLRAEAHSSRRLPHVLDAGCLVHRERAACSAISLPKDVDAYLKTLSPKFRTTLRYRTRKLFKTFAVRLVRTSREDELLGHLDSLFGMHEARWTADGRMGCFSDQRMRAFYREMSASFLRRGWLRFYHLEIDGRIRASQFGFAFGGVMHSLQEAFDHTFIVPGMGGLGVILRWLVLQKCIAERLHTYDFLGGTEPFKTRWATSTHFVERLRIAAPGAAGALAFTATAGVREAKKWGRVHLPARLFAARERWREWRRSRRARPKRVARLARSSK